MPHLSLGQSISLNSHFETGSSRSCHFHPCMLYVCMYVCMYICICICNVCAHISACVWCHSIVHYVCLTVWQVCVDNATLTVSEGGRKRKGGCVCVLWKFHTHLAIVCAASVSRNNNCTLNWFPQFLSQSPKRQATTANICLACCQPLPGCQQLSVPNCKLLSNWLIYTLQKVTFYPTDCRI